MAETRLVALVVDSTRAYHRKMIPGVTDYVREVGDWRLYVEEGPREQLPDFRTWNGDGIICSLENRRVRETLMGMTIPVVALERSGLRDWEPQIPSVGTDNRAIGMLGAQYLLDRGFRQLAFCGFPKSTASTWGYPKTMATAWSYERAEAFAARAKEAGVPCSIHHGRYHYTNKWSDMLEDMAGWINGLTKPVGLMAGKDSRARHVLEACRMIDARVPEDVAVIGVDNDEIMCDITQPKLTSIEQGARRIGYLAASMLDRLMAGNKLKKNEHNVIVEPEGVIARQSTDVLAIDDPEIVEAVRYVRENACHGMRVDDLVRQVHYSRSSLENKFKLLLGRTIHAEIRRVQFEEARELVLRSEMSFKQIAARAGFSHVQHMTNVFRELAGCPPGEYRKKWKR